VTAIRATLMVLGLAGVAYAVQGILFGAGTNPVGQFLFLASVLVAHDLVLLPLAIAVGFVAARYVPGWARAAVHGGLFASAVVAALSFPFVLGVGRMPANATVLPLNYGRGLLILLGVIWFVTAAFAILRRRRTRRTPATAGSSAGQS
jgi:hypothetical protein